MNKPTQSATKFAHQKKQEEREVWHKIVVKILRWKQNPEEGENLRPIGKITTKEWTTYSKSLIKMNATNSKEDTTKKLKIIKDLITCHGGFEE